MGALTRNCDKVRALDCEVATAGLWLCICAHEALRASVCHTYVGRETAYSQVCWEETFTNISQISTVEITRITAFSGVLQKSFDAKKVL